ncbi:DUF6916 family protein [Azospirillum doebereinerae]
MTVDLNTLSADAFAPHLNQTFRLLAPDDQSLIAEAELTKLTEHPEFTPRWAKRTGFSALFETFGAGDLHNIQCLIDHPTLGPLGPLYLVRVIPRDLDRACLELVMN